MDYDDLYEVLDGVRRSKAADMSGITSIHARIDYGGGPLSPVINVTVAQLRSPHKDIIDISTRPLLDHWLKTLQLTRQGSVSPPIIVRPGSKGPTIRNVKFQH